MEAILSMVIQKDVSEKVIFKLGSNVRRLGEKGVSWGGDSHPEGPEVGVFGEQRKPSVPGEQWVKERQVYRRAEERTWLSPAGL